MKSGKKSLFTFLGILGLIITIIVLLVFLAKEIRNKDVSECPAETTITTIPSTSTTPLITTEVFHKFNKYFLIMLNLT